MDVEFRGRDGSGLGQLLFDGGDLSVGGAFLKADLLFEIDEELELEFVLPGNQSPMRVKARVAWVRRFPREGENPGMGVKFTDVSPSDRTALAGFAGE